MRQNPSSIKPLQSLSTPSHASTLAAPAIAEHAVFVPLAQTIVPVRAHAPSPSVQAPPVGRHSPPQLDCPAVHDARHAPSTQAWPVAHALPHRPQWARSVVSARHVVPHAVCPSGHVTVVGQVPATHACPTAHARPHAPQLAPSLWTSRQAPPQKPCPMAHPHTPPTQTCPPTHALPQRPQCVATVPRFTSQPFAAEPSQSP